jgi:hypothetical protein
VEQSPCWEANRLCQLVKKFPAFYGIRTFITAFTSACHLSLTWVSSIQAIPTHPNSWRSILILFSHLSLGLPRDTFPQVSTSKPCIASTHPIRATCPAHPILLDLITRTILGEEYGSLSASLCSFLHTPFTSYLLGPNILWTPSSRTPSVYVPPAMWATKFHTHTQQAKL